MTSEHFKPELLQYLKHSLCSDKSNERLGREVCLTKFNQLLESLGSPPMYTTFRVNTREADIQMVLEELKTIVKEQYRVRQFPCQCPEICVHPKISDCIYIKSEGPCLIEKSDKEVVVDTSCGMAVLRGSDIFVQGILAASPAMNEGDEVSVYVDLDGACRKGLIKHFEGKKMFVGNGVAKFSRQEVFCSTTKLSGVGICMTKPLFRAPSLSDVAVHLVFPQNFPSIVCGHILDPRPGELILDMCAAPGGKTTHIGTLMKNQGRVVALDKNKNKIAKIRLNASRWHLDCIDAYSFSGTDAVCFDAEASRSPPFPPSTFDRVLLDAPCSGLGQRPLLRNDMSLKEVQSYPALQKQLFEKAVALLKVGGTLVYSTCTITLEENEAIVCWALQRFPCLTLDKPDLSFGGPGWPGSGLTCEQESLVQRFDPSIKRDDCSPSDTAVDLDTIGFFIAKFVKNSEHQTENHQL